MIAHFQHTMYQDKAKLESVIRIIRQIGSNHTEISMASKYLTRNKNIGEDETRRDEVLCCVVLIPGTNLCSVISTSSSASLKYSILYPCEDISLMACLAKGVRFPVNM